jgi:hypothetical protein
MGMPGFVAEEAVYKSSRHYACVAAPGSGGNLTLLPAATHCVGLLTCCGPEVGGLCFGQCCSPNLGCCPDNKCSLEDGTCCGPLGRDTCKGQCCPPGQQCVDGVSGQVCCPPECINQFGRCCDIAGGTEECCDNDCCEVGVEQCIDGECQRIDSGGGGGGPINGGNGGNGDDGGYTP